MNGIKKALLMASKPLKLQGTANTRELGGYRKENGTLTKTRKLLRSDSLESLIEEDIDFLKSYGVSCCIDFRTREVCRNNPSKLEDIRGIEYYNFPIDDHILTNDMSCQYQDMGDLYIEFLEKNKEQFYQALRIILLHGESTTIYHCTAGKDRTGLMSMLLLDLAGVPEEIILADYVVTEHYMQKKFDEMRKITTQKGIILPEYAFSSNAIQMKKALDYIKENFESTENYLEEIGFFGTEIMQIRNII